MSRGQPAAAESVVPCVVCLTAVYLLTVHKQIEDETQLLSRAQSRLASIGLLALLARFCVHGGRDAA